MAHFRTNENSTPSEYAATERRTVLTDMRDAAGVFFRLHARLKRLGEFRDIPESWLNSDGPDRARCDALVAALTEEKMAKLIDAAVSTYDDMLKNGPQWLKVSLKAGWMEKLKADRACLQKSMENSDKFVDRMMMGMVNLKAFREGAGKLLKLRGTDQFYEAILDDLPAVLDAAVMASVYFRAASSAAFELFYGMHQDGPHTETSLMLRFGS